MEPKKALETLRVHQYFKGCVDAEWCSEGAADPWPAALDSAAERDLAITALGALSCHLTRIKVRIAKVSLQFVC